jgi:hypothetical protein
MSPLYPGAVPWYVPGVNLRALEVTQLKTAKTMTGMAMFEKKRFIVIFLLKYDLL